jgi:signal peptidase I
LISAGVEKFLSLPIELQYPYKNHDSITLLTLSSKSRGEETILISKLGIKRVDSNLYVTAPKERIVPKISKVKRFIRFNSLFFGWLFASLILVFVALDVAGVTQARAVLTSSMAPTIEPGDVVISVSPHQISPKKGKIITYIGRRLDGSPVALFTHRIIGGDATAGYVVKGDANPSSDTQKPTTKDITGVVLFTIPWLGKFTNPHALILVLLAGFGLWLIWDAFRGES